MSSTLQNLTSWTAEKAKRFIKAKKHFDFMCELYREQIQQGRWVLHEHPASATSWNHKAVVEIFQMEGMHSVLADQCRFGLSTKGPDGRQHPAKKRTRFMSNAPEILVELNQLCRGNHYHQPLVSGRAGPAARYPEGLYRAICRGLIRQIERQRQHVRHLLTVEAIDLIDELPGEEEDYKVIHTTSLE